MYIRAITNQKGGVGKTTTSVNVGAAMAEAGLKVLLIDLDPQGNLSTHVGLDIYNLELTLYDVLTQDRPLVDVLLPTGHENLYCAPSNIDLSSAEMEIVTTVGRETILKEALETLANDPKCPLDFDTVLIDCPPSLGLLSINALVAADELIVPMQTEFFALQGMSKLMETYELVKKRLNAKLRIGGIVACRMDTRTRLSAEVLDDIAGHFPELLFKTRIRQNVKLAEAPSFGQTVIQYAPDSNGAEDYRNLTAEIMGITREIPEEPLAGLGEDEEEELEEVAPEAAADEIELDSPIPRLDPDINGHRERKPDSSAAEGKPQNAIVEVKPEAPKAANPADDGEVTNFQTVAPKENDGGTESTVVETNS
ncbi:MAG: AAA family ATPase [Planctomycetota bacterium]